MKKRPPISSSSAIERKLSSSSWIGVSSSVVVAESYAVKFAIQNCLGFPKSRKVYYDAKDLVDFINSPAPHHSEIEPIVYNHYKKMNLTGYFPLLISDGSRDELILQQRTIFTNQGIDGFLECLAINFDQYGKIEVYAPKDVSYMKILQSAIRNDRFKSPETPKPLLIVTPRHELILHITTTCSIRHDRPCRSSRIDVDIEDNSVWVQAGATIGELYYRIAMESPIHNFSSGFVTTIGVGGHFSVGGYGAMMRKYGLAADNAVEARLVNVN
ncbi:hypothetical protein Syun_009097 [Stephania yunnanensis]|uniref:FAD linked oxidase N-terminal domain-containing protein n=1 Tax=Stephania yunnanensis TaxID=152371 RepID=A0AAP0PN66_9MAGN